MKQYKYVLLNRKKTIFLEKILAEAEEITNAMAEEGWELLQVVKPDGVDMMYGIFIKEV